MTDTAGIRAKWTGDSFVPIGNWSTAWCHDNLRVGETVGFEVEKDRDPKAHRHQFAWVKTAWENLSDEHLDAPYARSPDALRKHALVATGFCDVATYDLGAKATAERLAPVLEADGTKVHGYCIVQVRGPIVTRITPKSQSVRAMGGDEFKRSKAAILDFIAGLINVNPDDLRRAA